MTAPLVPIALLWTVGLLVGGVLGWPWMLWLALCPLVVALALLVAPRWGPPTGALLFHPPLYATLLAMALLLGAARGAAAAPHFGVHDLATYNDGGEAEVLATVSRYPEARGTATRYEMSAQRLRLADGREVAVRGRFLATLPPYPAYRYGDRLWLRGDLVTPPVLDGFDYRAFLAHQGIYALLQRPHASLDRASQGAPLLEVLYALRQRAERVLQQVLPEPHASLMSGILLGIESGIPDDVMEAFSATGTTHVLVISGSNFAILSALFLLLGQRLLGEKRGTLLALLGIVLYALLVGAEPPVLRAAVMGSVAVLALLMRRQGVALNTLAFAVIAMTAYQPGQLHQVSFQLSALATLGLILFVPPLTRLAERLLARLPLADTRRATLLALLGDALLVTLAAQIITTPLIVGTFGRLSLVSLLTNLLILPVQSWLLVSGGLAALGGMLWLPLGRVLAAIPYAGLAWTVTIVEATATLPLASVAVGPFPPALIWLGYALGLGGWALHARHPNAAESARPVVAAPVAVGARPFYAAAALLALGVMVWVLRQLPDGKLHLYALDIGQGDALLIVTPDGKQILVDGGPNPVALLNELGATVPPWDRTIEMVILSHADADHLAGLPELLGRYNVGEVMDSGVGHDTALYAEWVRRLALRERAPTTATPGQRWDLGRGATLEVIAPTQPLFDDLNDNAVVLRLRYGDFCALLTGDIERDAEARLVQRGAVDDCQVLKVAHHGSDTSSTLPFLDAANPAIAIISVGADNDFGHPVPDILDRLTAHGLRILRTDQHGRLHLWSDGRALWVETER